MTYSSIQPPFALKFPEMPKTQLVAYREWFHAVMPERIVELTNAVKSTAGFEDRQADLTPNSLGPLGEWFLGQVEIRKRTDVEMGDIESELTFSLEVPNEELTTRTFSLAMDVGMYFGQVILKNVAGARWDQSVRNPKFADHGQPVIMGLGTVPLNPVRIAVTLAYTFAAKEQPGNRLRALYDVWLKKRG